MYLYAVFPLINFILLLIGSSCLAVKPDEFFKICKRNDPHLNQCVLNTMKQMKSKLKKGIQELQIPSIEPMLIPALQIGAGPIDTKFTNLKINGLSNYEITKVRTNLNNNEIEFEATLPFMLNEGDYEINGTILILPISGKGSSWTNYTSVSIKGSINGKPIQKKGKTFLDVENFKVDLNVGKANIHMDNLFNGNRALGDAMNEFMSENWQEFYKELKPAINIAVGSLFKNIAVRVFSKFPMDELFPV